MSMKIETRWEGKWIHLNILVNISIIITVLLNWNNKIKICYLSHYWIEFCLWIIHRTGLFRRCILLAHFVFNVCSNWHDLAWILNWIYILVAIREAIGSEIIIKNQILCTKFLIYSKAVFLHLVNYQSDLI